MPDTPQSLPERHLNLFFHTLKVPYRAFEAENPQSVAEAITEIDKLERNPIRYQERIPEHDLTGVAYGIAAGALLLLLLAKLAEVRLDAGAPRDKLDLRVSGETKAHNSIRRAA